MTRHSIRTKLLNAVISAVLLTIGGAVEASPAVATTTPCTDSLLGTTSIHLCITAPTAGAQASGVVHVSATADVTGRDPVRAVAFFVNGTYALADLESDLPVRKHEPQVYGFDLPTDRWPDGAAELGVQAWMRSGAVSQLASADVTIANGGVGAPVNDGSFTPPAVTPAPGAPLVVGAVGDGAAGLQRVRPVTDLVASWNPDLFLYLGDVYLEGTDAEFYNWYGNADGGKTPSDQSFARFRSITAPTVGNHEYSGPAGERPYADYWDMGPTSRHYYSFDAGGWHFVSLDSTPSGQFNETAPGTAQYDWLASDLAATDARGDNCTMVYFHHPMWHKGGQTATRLAPLWNLFAAHGVEIVLNGHIHEYERWQSMNANGEPSANGVTQIVAGTGGESLSGGTVQSPKVLSTYSGTGALQLSLYPDRADFRFYSTADPTTPIDSSSAAGPIICHGPPVDATPPSAPRITSLTSTWGRVHLSWSAASDDVGVSAYDVYRNGTLIGSTDSVTTTYADGGLHLGDSNTYVVTARDMAGHSTASGPSTITVTGHP